MTSEHNDALEKWVGDFRQQWENHLADWTTLFPTVGDRIVHSIAECGESFGQTLRGRLIRIDDEFQSIRLKQLQILDDFEDACRIADEQKAPLPDPASASERHFKVYPGTMIELLFVYWQYQAARSPGSNEADWMTFPPHWPSDVVDRAGERWRRSKRHLDVGVTFAGCHVEAHVGSGGFGDVYKVTQPPFAVKRALKVLRGDKLWALSQTQQERRGETLFSEATTLDKLSQNAIFPKVHYAGVYDRKHYIIMEFLDGQTLRERQKSSSRMPPAEVCRLGSKVAEGLDFAVQLGVIHGDISPQNILVMNGYGNNPKIIDFSAVNQRQADPAVAASAPDKRIISKIVGTEGFIADEVLNGTADHGEPSEVFSLAATLFHAITGKVPVPNVAVSDGERASFDINMFVSESAHTSASGVFRTAVSANPTKRPTLRQFGMQLERIASDFRQVPAILKSMDLVETEIVPQIGHGAAVTACAISADGKLLLTGSTDCNAILWDIHNGTILRTFDKHTGGIDFVAICSDGVHALTCSSHDNFRLLDMPTARESRPFLDSTLVALAARGALVVNGSYDTFRSDFRVHSHYFEQIVGFVIAKNVKAEISRQTHGSKWDYYIRLSGANGDFKSFSIGESDLIRCSGDAATAVSIKGDICSVWDLKTGNKTLTFEHAVFESISAQERFALKQFATHPNAPARFFAFPANNVALSADGQRLILGDSRITRIWSLSTGEVLRTIEFEEKVASVAISSNGKLACTGLFNGQCIVWDTETGSQVQLISGHVPSGHAGRYAIDDSTGLALALSREGKLILAGKFGALVFDGQSCNRYSFEIDTTHDVRLAVSNDSTLILVGQCDTHVLIDSRTGATRTFSRKIGGTSEVELSSDGSVAFAGARSKNCGMLWNTQTLKLISSFEWDVSGPDYRRKLAISADGSRVFTGYGTASPSLWDVCTGKRIRTFDCAGDISSVGLCSNGAMAVTGYSNGFVTLWNSESGEIIRKFEKHNGAVTLTMVSSDDNLVLTGSDDRTAILWDLHTGVEQVVFRGHASPITALAISDDGKHVVTSGSDGTTRIWDPRTGEELCKLIVFDAGKHWLVLDPMGRFDCSEGGLRHVEFRLRGSLQLIASERAKADHFTPGLLQSILAR